jgi:hypothetical protein
LLGGFSGHYNRVVISVVCACGYAAKIPETFVGQKLRCPKCANFIDTTAPSPAASPAAVPASPAPEAAAPVDPPPPAGAKLCRQCKKPMRDEQMVCLLCGMRVDESESARIERRMHLEDQASANEVNDLGKKAILWSLFGLLCLPVGIVGGIFGIQSVTRSREYKQPVNGMALGALIITGIQLSAWLLWFFLFIFSIQLGMKSSEQLGEKLYENLPPPGARPPMPPPEDWDR